MAGQDTHTVSTMWCESPEETSMLCVSCCCTLKCLVPRYACGPARPLHFNLNRAVPHDCLSRCALLANASWCFRAQVISRRSSSPRPSFGDRLAQAAQKQYYSPGVMAGGGDPNSLSAGKDTPVSAVECVCGCES